MGLEGLLVVARTFPEGNASGSSWPGQFPHPPRGRPPEPAPNEINRGWPIREQSRSWRWRCVGWGRRDWPSRTQGGVGWRSPLCGGGRCPGTGKDRRLMPQISRRRQRPVHCLASSSQSHIARDARSAGRRVPAMSNNYVRKVKTEKTNLYVLSSTKRITPIHHPKQASCTHSSTHTWSWINFLDLKVDVQHLDTMYTKLERKNSTQVHRWHFRYIYEKQKR
jgi:hypothetical protein